MNPFVNLNQRGIELPPGCKDLIDTLGSQNRQASGAKQGFSEGIDAIPRYVTRLLESKALGRVLSMVCVVPPAAMVLEFGTFFAGYRPGGLSGLVFVDGNEPLLESAVRGVFGEAGFSPFAEFGVGGGVEPMRMLRYALPDRAGEAANLVTNVLIKGFGVPESARFCFNYFERE